MLISLLPAQGRLIISLIFYGLVVVTAGWFLIVTSRKGRLSERREAFRRPARVRALGILLLAALAVVVLTAGNKAPAWDTALGAAWLVVSIALIWTGHRMFGRAADAYPAGKHAHPATPRESRWHPGRP